MIVFTLFLVVTLCTLFWIYFWFIVQQFCEYNQISIVVGPQSKRKRFSKSPRSSFAGMLGQFGVCQCCVVICVCHYNVFYQQELVAQRLAQDFQLTTVALAVSHSSGAGVGAVGQQQNQNQSQNNQIAVAESGIEELSRFLTSTLSLVNILRVSCIACLAR